MQTRQHAAARGQVGGQRRESGKVVQTARQNAFGEPGIGLTDREA